MPNYRKRARRYARQEGISDPNLFVRQIGAESGFNPGAHSGAGAIGIAQIMPETARGWGVDPNNPDAALRAAARHMAQYEHQYGNYRDALVAYNAGPGRVGKPLFPETKGYIDKIMGGGAIAGVGSSPVSSSPSSVAPSGGPNIFETLARLNAPMAAQDPNYAQLQRGWDLLAAIQNKQGQGTQQPTLADTTAMPNGHAPAGTAMFEGQRVAKWMVPALQFARQNGWKGDITSGVRSREEQQALWNNRANNPYPVARPGQSNHEAENGGAVDVTDPDTLAQLMKRFRGRRLVQGTAINDPIHFSLTGR